MSRRKGNRTVRKLKALFLEDGWLFDKVEKKGKFLKEKDLFGLIDVIALKEGRMRMIQVKTNTPPNLGRFQEWAETHLAGNKWVVLESWTWYDCKGWVVHRFVPGGPCRVDLRGIKKDLIRLSGS